MFAPSHKKILLGVLVVCFGVQTALVYGDTREPPLSARAIEGRAIYHEHACQVCHQLYGQGGFLGPDLTNAASRVDPVRLRSLLTVGSGQMPALGLDEDQVEAVAAFLREIDRPDLGRGQLRLGRPGASTQAAFASAVEAALPRDGAEARGFEVFRAQPCSQCHVPFATSVVGAPDLSTVAGRLSLEEVRSVLREGRPEKGMPPSGLDDASIRDVAAYLGWLSDERARVRADADARRETRDVDWSELPWWEYR